MTHTRIGGPYLLRDLLQIALPEVIPFDYDESEDGDVDWPESEQSNPRSS